MGDSIFDDADDSAGIGGLPSYKPGTYYVLITDVSERSDEWKILKIAGVVIHVVNDLGDSNAVEDEVEAAIFKKKKDKFFEADTRKWFKAGKNIASKDEVNALPMATIGEFLIGKKQIVGRVIEVKGVPYEKKDGSGMGVQSNPVRALSAADLQAAGVKGSLIGKYAPSGVKHPVTGKREGYTKKAAKAAAPAAEEE